MTTYPHQCERCKDRAPFFGKWEGKIENPRQCPLCKSPFWRMPVKDVKKSDGAKSRVTRQETNEGNF